MATDDGLDAERERVSPAARGAREVMSRALVTLGAVGAVWLLRYVPLPYLNLLQVDEIGARSVLSVGALGLTPWVSAFVLVELVALMVPSLRRRRDAGPEAREPLRRAALLLGVGLAAVQTVGLTLWIDGLGFSTAATWMQHLAQPLALVAGACGTLLAAAVVSSRGLGDGFALFFVFDVLQQALVRPGLGVTDGSAVVRTDALWLVVLSLLVGVALTRFRSQRLPGPISGIGALSLPTWAAMPLLFANTGVPQDALADLGIALPAQIATVAVLTMIFSLIFTPPRAAQAALVRVGAVPDALAARGEYLRALLLAVAAVTGIAFAAWELAPPAIAPFLVSLIPVTAYVLDVAAETRFRWQHGACFVVDELHRPYLLAERVASLPAGTPVHARALCFRSLLQFFGPYVPVLLLVPEDDGAHEGAADDATIVNAEQDAQ